LEKQDVWLNASMPSPVEEVVKAVWVAYKRADLPGCLALAAKAVAQFPTHGSAWFVYGCALERSNDLIAADKAFAKASRCSEEPVGTPYRIGWVAFQQVVATAVEALPAKLKESLGDVTLILADYAESELLEDFEDSELLGLFSGPVRSERDDYPELSPTIYVFRRAHEHSCATATEFRAEVKQTLYHEFGHYLGFGEEDLESLGMG
jgi:predicted Zn-dependent protease with MMP-like domain